MPEILINYADEMIVGVFCLWGIRLNRTANIFLGAKAPLCEKTHKGAFLLCLFAVVKLVVGQGIFHKVLGHVEVIC